MRRAISETACGLILLNIPFICSALNAFSMPRSRATSESAAEVLSDLIECYEGTDGPLVYPLFLRDGDVLIGHIEAVPLEDGDWEVGYHIGEDYQGNGYAQEAVQAFTPVMMKKLNIKEMFGISRADNPAFFLPGAGKSGLSV